MRLPPPCASPTHRVSRDAQRNLKRTERAECEMQIQNLSDEIAILFVTN